MNEDALRTEQKALTSGVKTAIPASVQRSVYGACTTHITRSHSLYCVRVLEVVFCVAKAENVCVENVSVGFFANVHPPYTLSTL
jgi:hypothetical protein